MKRIEVQYVNEYREKEVNGGLAFLALVSLGFICVVGAMYIFWLVIV